MKKSDKQKGRKVAVFRDLLIEKLEVHPEDIESRNITLVGKSSLDQD